MHKQQADAVADELLAPEVAALEQSRHANALAAARQRDNTIRAWLMLVGFACGAAIAYATGERMAKGGLLGGFAGVAVSYLVNTLRRAR